MLIPLDSLLVYVPQFQLFLHLLLVVAPDDIRVRSSETQEVGLPFYAVLMQIVNGFAPAEVRKKLIGQLYMDSRWLMQLPLLECRIQRFLLCSEESEVRLSFIV